MRADAEASGRLGELRAALVAAGCVEGELAGLGGVAEVGPGMLGGLVQAAMDLRERRQLGVHYTCERDVLRVVGPLFLAALTERLAGLSGDAAGLREFLAGLRRLRIFDPACGCGDFLIVAYRELRRVETRALLALGEVVEGRVGLDQVVGIEISEAAVRVAEVGLWLVDRQCERELVAVTGWEERAAVRPGLVVGNALRVAWSEVVPASDDVVVLGNPPFVGKHQQTAAQKVDMRAIFAANAGDLDYVACWFVVAARYVQGTRARCGFVATNSISQGEQVPLLWRVLFEEYAIKVHFARRTFCWHGAANVHVVIVGFGAFDREGKRIFDGEESVRVANIGPYLTAGPDRWVGKARAPGVGVPVMRCGSKPSDGGALIFSEAERAEFLAGEPGAAPLFRRYCGSEEFLNGGMRWCLWLYGVEEAVIRGLPAVAARVERVRRFRAASTAAPTRAAAGRAGEFFHVAQPAGDYLVVPEVSSERRRYIPVGYLPGAVIASNKLYVVESADMFVFGALMSAMHMAWVRVVCGRLKSDFQYSATMVFNTFPWPTRVGDGERAAVEAAARGVLAARVECGERTLAELYDPRTMPAALGRAHDGLDAAVDRCYRAEGFVDDAARFEHALACHHGASGG